MTIDELFTVIKNRRGQKPEASYVASLLANRDRLIQKIGEEATEVVVAAKNNDKTRQIEEITDLLFHMIVLLASLDLRPNDIYEELEQRKKKPRRDKIIL